MNLKPITTALAATAIVMTTVTATATSASALGGYDDGFKRVSTLATLDVGVDYVGTRSLGVQAIVSDATGDVYCTIAKAALYDRRGHQLGSDVVLGSACSAQRTLPFKSISTAAGDISHVIVWTELGTTGRSNGGNACYRATDSTNGNLHSCS